MVMESVPVQYSLPKPALAIDGAHSFDFSLVRRLDNLFSVDILATFTYSKLMPFIVSRVFFDLRPHRALLLSGKWVPLIFGTCKIYWCHY